MEASSFQPDMPGRLVPVMGGLAFVPAPLPPRVAPDWGLMGLIEQAEHALGRLGGPTAGQINPYLLMNPFLRREAILSSRIEGTFTTPQQLVLFEGTARVPEASAGELADAREVANYIRAMEHGLALLKTLPICLRLIREVHGVLMHDVRGGEARPGEFRALQNAIGSHGQDLATARFVPPPVPEMTSALADLERFIAEPSELPLLVRMALIHYQFEAIHPFMDGNGRVGRLLIPLILCGAQRLPQPLLYLSAYFERNRAEYMDLLLAVSQRAAWAPWISFFVRGVIEQAGDAIARARAVLALREDYRRKTHGARASSLLPKLVDQLFVLPLITVPQAAKHLGVTQAAARAIVERLVAQGILAPAGEQKRNKAFLAPKILEIIEN